MSSIKVKTAFTAEFKHTYYDSTPTFPAWDQHLVNESLLIEPTEETARVLSGARMLFRKTPKGFSILYKNYLDTGTNTFEPFTKLADTDMVFALKLNPEDKAEFLNYTKLYEGAGPLTMGKEYSPDKLVYLSAAAPGNMSYSLIDYLRPDLFTYEFILSSGTGDATVELTYEGEMTPTLTITDIPQNNGLYSVSIDMRGKKKGFYTLEADNGSSSSTVTVYIDNNLYGKDIFGIIKLPFDDNVYPPTNAAPPNYLQTFEARPVQWRYFVVIRTTPAPIEIVSADANYSFTLLGTVTIDGYTTNVYHSRNGAGTVDAYIPFRKNPYTSFKLIKTGIPNPGLISPLPNPKIDGFDSDRYAQITAGTTKKNVAEMFVFVDGMP